MAVIILVKLLFISFVSLTKMEYARCFVSVKDVCSSPTFSSLVFLGNGADSNIPHFICVFGGSYYLDLIVR